jgi:hypothetical protein
MASTKKPSVVAALKADPFKSLLALGFSQHGGKRFRRLVGRDVAQFVFLHVENRLHRAFMIEYCSILICVPRTFHSLEHGGQFPVGSNGRSYRAEPDEALARSVAFVAAELPSLLRWFEASATLPGFLDTYRERVAQEPPRMVTNGHTSFTFACGAAALGDLTGARVHAERAMEEFQATHADFVAQFPAHDHWAPERIERCVHLLDAIGRGQPGPLLEQWRNETSAALLSP